MVKLKMAKQRPKDTVRNALVFLMVFALEVVGTGALPLSEHSRALRVG